MKKELNKAKKGQVAVRLIFLSVATFFVATVLAITAVSAATWVGPTQSPPLDNLSGFINNTTGGGGAQTASFNVTGSGAVGTLTVSQDAVVGNTLTVTTELCLGSSSNPANCKTSWPASDPNAGQWGYNPSPSNPLDTPYIYNQNATIGTDSDYNNAQEIRVHDNGLLQVYGANDWLEFKVNNNLNYSEIRWGDDVGDRLRFYFWASLFQFREVMTLLSNGNVGIGQTSPATLLEVATSNSLAFPTSGTGNLSTLHSVVKINNKNASAKAAGLTFAVDTEYIDEGDINLVSNADGAIGSRFAFRLRSDPNAWGEKFSILSSGNVGIGVTAPLAKLQVAAHSSTEPALLISQSSTGDIFQAFDGFASVFVIKDGGNVGIGPGTPNKLPFPKAITAPGTTLSVNDPDAGDMARVNIVADWPMFGIVETGFGSVPDNRIFAIQMNNGVIKMRGIEDDGTTERSSLLEFNLAAGTTNLGGKVGINKASPSGKLHVYSDTATAGSVNRALHVEAMGTGNETNIAIRGEAQAGTSFNSFGGFFVGGLYADRICLGSTVNCITSWPTGSGSNTSGWTDAGTYVQLQTATDNVGIGTNSPLAKLHVQGAGTGNVLLGAWSANSAYGSIYLNGSTVASNYNFLSSPSDTNLYINRPSGKVIAFREANGGTANMTIAAGGNVGININSPSYKLDVNGITNLRSSVGLDIRTKICTNLATCTCDSDYIILSGGARCTSGFNPQLSKSYPLSLTTWEAQCAFGQSFDIYLTCVKGFDNS